MKKPSEYSHRCNYENCDRTRYLYLWRDSHLYCEQHRAAMQFTYDLRRENAKRLGMEVPAGL